MDADRHSEDDVEADVMNGFDDDLDGAIDSFDDSGRDMMLDGGMHLMGGVKKPNCLFDNGSGMMPGPAAPSNDCVTKVASECFDLNQFICKMDELVYS